MTGAPPRSPGDGSTQIDLGEDLLAEPQPEARARAAPESALSLASDDPHEQLRNAEILANEGFLEDAKRLLRQLLVRDPHFVPARDRLHEIHERELRQILGPGEGAASPPFDRRRRPEARIAPDDVLRRLDEDLGLGIGDEPLPSLLSDREAMRRFAEEADRALAGAGARDRVDLGIAFLEMGLVELAAEQFAAAAAGADADDELRFAAWCLRATAQLAAGRAADAVHTLEPAVNDQDRTRTAKIEAVYLMGRAQEARQRHEEALSWYRQVLAIERRYRDAEERARRLAGPARSPR